MKFVLFTTTYLSRISYMPERKSILFLSNRSLLPIKDGHTRRSYNILKGLASQHNVHFVALYETPEEMDYENLNSLNKLCSKVELIKAPSKSFSFEMLTRLFLSLFSIDPYTLWRHFSPQYRTLVENLIATGTYDIVHCDNLPVAYTCRREASTFRSITDHDVSYIKCVRRAKETQNLFLKLFLYFEAFKLKEFEKRIFDKFDLGIVVSRSDKFILKSISKAKKFLVIENGVDTDLFKPLENSYKDTSSLIWLGGFGDQSNESCMFSFLKFTYPDIKKNVSDVVLKIIGDKISNRLLKLIKNDSSICYLGFVSDPIPHLQRSTIFIAPIISGSGTKLKVIEAMAVGKAVVTTSVGCEGIEGVNGIHYVVEDIPKNFGKAVINLLRNSSERNRIENNARALAVERYDWSIILEKLNMRYSKIENFNINKNFKN